MKNITLLVSIIGVLAYYALDYSEVVRLCQLGDDYCANLLDTIGVKFSIFLPTLFFAFVTYKLRDEVFRNWAYFTVIWVPIFLLVAFLMPEDSTSGGWAVPTFSAKASWMFFLWAGYIVGSVLTIAISYLSIVWRKK